MFRPSKNIVNIRTKENIMTNLQDLIKRRPWVGWLLLIVTAGIVFALGLLASSIVERKTEMQLRMQVMVPLAETETRNEVWGENFPREYERYKSTADGDFASQEGGSVEIDMLQRDPRLVVLWAGYAFSKDYKQGRGHYNAVKDVTDTLRVDEKNPATCWTCKSPGVVKMMKEKGPKEFYAGKWKDSVAHMTDPIGCLDCHNPQNMKLTITRPALVEAFDRMGQNVGQSTHQQMRSLVCAQCHVEYYFKGDGKYLTFPWDKGFSVEQMEEYYDEINHVDWVHALSKTPMLKAQHPDYELFEKGIHAQRGVGCADCHMPYRTEGATKFTDHKIQSPLANIANSCQVCHRESEETLRHNVFERQEKVRELRLKAEDLLVRAHYEAKAAWDAGATEEEMKPVLTLIRHAQWRWDFVAASHGASFHAPLESARILGTSIDKSSEARRELVKILVKHGVTDDVALPDISTKENAQKSIGLNMDEIIHKKREFLKAIAVSGSPDSAAH